MSENRSRRPVGPAVIRRSVRHSTTIELPILPEREGIPHPGRYAQIFILALATIIVAGTLLLATPWTTEDGSATPPVDAFFTAVSATAVTGLVTVDTKTHWNLLGEIVILVLIQIGGLGFMVGASVILQALRRGATRLSDVLLIKEGAPTFSLQEAVTLSRHIVIFTLAVEAVGALILTLRFWQDMPFFEALWFGVFHSIAAFCNAGFDLQGSFQSLLPYQSSLVVNGMVMALIQAGALSYIVFADVYQKRRWSKFALDTKLVLMANGILVFAGAALFLILEWGGSLGETSTGFKPVAALFQSVSARTAGFTTVNFAEVHQVTLFLWVAIMMIGGASGSTAGGVKLATIGVVAAAVVSSVKGQEETQLFGRRISTTLVFRAMAVIAIMMSVHFGLTALLATFEGIYGGSETGFIVLMFETMSALATVGISPGITPSLSDPGKLVLCVAMFFGRLGPLTVVYALQRRQRATPYRFPVAPVRIG